MKNITLNNGVKMPILGYGVFQVTKEQCEVCALDTFTSIILSYKILQIPTTLGES